MKACDLTVFDGTGQNARSLIVQLPEAPHQDALELVFQQCIHGHTFSYAILEDDRGVRGLFLHPQLLPDGAIPLGTRRRVPGRWITHRVSLGASAGGRGYLGPDVFFRQVDLDTERAWLAPWLMRLADLLPTERFEIDDDELWLFRFDRQRFYYRAQGPAGTRWALYGAGNTPEPKHDLIFQAHTDRSTADALWAAGAIRLGQSEAFDIGR